MSDTNPAGEHLGPATVWSCEMLPTNLRRFGEYLDENWRTKVENPSRSSYTPEMLSGHVLRNMVSLADQELRDYDLWDMFRTIFENWKLQDWKRTPGPVLKIFRNFLFENGVYTKIDNGSIAVKLDKLIASEDAPEYPSEDIQNWLNKGKNFNSRFNPLDPLNPVLMQNSSKSNTNTRFPFQNRTEAPQFETGVVFKDSPRSSQSPKFGNNFMNNAPSREVTNLMKIYQDDNKKYGGEMYESLDTKLKIFEDCCIKVGIHETQYHYAFSAMLKGRAIDFYYQTIALENRTFSQMVALTKNHFETEAYRQLYITEWKFTTFRSMLDKNENPTLSQLDVLESLFDKLRKVQQCLPQVYHSDLTLRDQIINACESVPECEKALFRPASTSEGVCAELRNAIRLSSRHGVTSQFSNNTEATNKNFNTQENKYENGNHWTDRQYGGQFNRRGRGGQNRIFRQRRPSNFQKSPRQTDPIKRIKMCYVCKKQGCWSTNHSQQEIDEAYKRFSRKAEYPTRSYFATFLANFEGIKGIEENEDYSDTEQCLMEMENQLDDNEDYESFVTEMAGNVNGPEAISILNDQSVFHCITKKDMFQEQTQAGIVPRNLDVTKRLQSTRIHQRATIENTIFMVNRYSSDKFHGILPDTGAAGVSTAGEPQFIALQNQVPTLQIDATKAGEHTIKFGIGKSSSLGTINVTTPIGQIIFHVVPVPTPFLLCLADMDKLGVTIDNLRNVMVQGTREVPIIRKWGHPWLLLGHQIEEAVAFSHLTELELRQLHRRFGHPSVHRLYRILQRAGHHDVKHNVIEHLTKVCHQCQMNAKSPGRFRFTLKDDYEFNYSVIIDVLYIDGRPVLQVVDEATAFQAARFLKSMSAKSTWEALRHCWIDTYQGPPDMIVADAGKNFMSQEFRQNADALAINVKIVPVESHNSVGKVERYHLPLRRAFEIIRDELHGSSYDRNIILQMAVKAVNDSAGPDGIVPTLLVFGAYPRMTKDSLPSPEIAQRAEVIRKAMKEVRQLKAKRYVTNAMSTRNGPSTAETVNLPLQSSVRVFRENRKWTGPHKLISTDGETCIVDMPHGPTHFRSVVVKPYYMDEDLSKSPRSSSAEPETQRNKDDYPAGIQTERAKEIVPGAQEAFLGVKEASDIELSLKLRKEGIITTPGEPFEVSTNQEIEGLIGRGVFTFIQKDTSLQNKRIFNSRIVKEIKGKSTISPFEKSRLVIQAYDDPGKELILTQSPTIQRVSQRLIVALAPSLMKLPGRDINLWLRDITQAYSQSTTNLQRTILAELPKELRHKYPEGTIMAVVKPLYGIAEAGTHWWATYFKHHREKLQMTTSTYDPCLLVTVQGSGNFGLVGMQTDDTLLLIDKAFHTLEEEKLNEAKFVAKPKEKLAADTPLFFNGCSLDLIDGSDNLELKQKEQGKKIEPIDTDMANFKQLYVQQRARGAYIASICQPEASFDLSVAAQHQNPSQGDVIALNKRLKWQINSISRGLKYIPLDLTTGNAKLFVFVDGSFANNKDFSSQIGYEIIIANETPQDENIFKITGNMIHWSSTKSKRVTRSVLASEIYGMVAGVDMAFAISTTLKIITDQLNLPPIPTIVCTDSYSLYECLVKLGTTKEKRLMIDIMAIRQSYERREIYDIRWINGADNPADAMTKVTPNKALEQFIDSNSLAVRVQGWVKRTS